MRSSAVPGGAPRVVVVGAGFAGLWAARALAGGPVDLLLIDRRNYHTFLPLLYQVAASEVEPEAIAYPVRSILRSIRNSRFMLADVERLDLDGRVLVTSAGPVAYDVLILAQGSVSHYFNLPGAADHTFPLKTLEEGVALRNHVLSRFERASHMTDQAARRRALAFAIIGGGPTGVEFAGALAELVWGPLVRDFPALDPADVSVILIEAMDGLLPGLPLRLSRYAARRLRRMGVDVRLGAAVTQVAENAVALRDGAVIPTETVVWTAGVRGVPAVEAWGLPVARAGRVAVLPTLQLPEHPEVYVAGDLAYGEADGRPLPQIAPVATQQGEAAARNVLRQIRGKEPVPFRYRDRGTMVTIGRNAAVAQVWGLPFTGFPAWVVWLSVHLVNLIGFRNRLLVLAGWAWDYFFYERAVRLIFPAGMTGPRQETRPPS